MYSARATHRDYPRVTLPHQEVRQALDLYLQRYLRKLHQFNHRYLFGLIELRMDQSCLDFMKHIVSLVGLPMKNFKLVLFHLEHTSLH